MFPYNYFASRFVYAAHQPKGFCIVFEQALTNIQQMLREETDCAAELNTGTLWSILEKYLEPDREKGEDVRHFFEQLENVATGSDHALVRYLFSAATSEHSSNLRPRSGPPCHFLLLSNVDPDLFLTEVRQLADHEWEQNSRHRILVQRETRSISLTVRETQAIENRHDQYVKPSANATNFPYLMNWLEAFSSNIGNGSLQMARVVKLKARSQVYTHVDRGLYYLIRDRYHLVLQSRLGSRMQCESEISVWYPGQVWWFNNHVPHQAFNDSDDERIHVVFDVLPHRNQMLALYLQEYAINLKQ